MEESGVQSEETVLLTKMTMMPDGETDETKGRNGSTFTSQTGSDVMFHDLDPTCCGKTKRFFKATYELLRSLIGMVLILIAYSFLGAYIFMVIESKHEIQYKENITVIRDRLVKASFDLSKTVQTESKWQEIMSNMLLEYEDAVKEAKDSGVASPSNEIVWDFWNSLFFVGTIYTTIGYGNISPSTNIGRLACILYAAIGIPLALLVLAELGKRITIGLKILWAFARRWYYSWRGNRASKELKHQNSTDDPEAPESESKPPESDRSRSGSRVLYGYEIDEEFNLPILLAVIILVVYILLGSVMYSRWEEWDAITAVYFVFVSLSTIGFGDILPAHPKFFMITFIYIFIGLSLVSMVINVAIEFFSQTVDRAREKMEMAKVKVKSKVNQASKAAMDKVVELKENIKDETAKIISKTEERYKKRSSSRSRSSTPVSTDLSEKENSPTKSTKGKTRKKSCDTREEIENDTSLDKL